MKLSIIFSGKRSRNVQELFLQMIQSLFLFKFRLQFYIPIPESESFPLFYTKYARNPLYFYLWFSTEVVIFPFMNLLGTTKRGLLDEHNPDLVSRFVSQRSHLRESN